MKTFIMEFLRELLYFFKIRKKYWLIPLILILLFLSFIIIITGGTALAPFIYTIF
ncbi:hypothetical protein EZS27_010697 [termite gut metagenome]|jgi:hypothetical protein|uniref:ABC transporter permease n=1 Tax=termite gut metagenome TaxID=433724 RepID=A0A5J4S5X4_9ZZZZ